MFYQYEYVSYLSADIPVSELVAHLMSFAEALTNEISFTEHQLGTNSYFKFLGVNPVMHV